MKNKSKNKKAIGIVFAVILAVSVFTVAIPGIALELNNVVMGDTNTGLSPDLEAKSIVMTENVKSNLTDAQKKLSTDLLQLVDSSYLPKGQDREMLKMEMERLGQFRPASSVSPTGDGSVADDLVYVYVYLKPFAGTRTIEPYVWGVTDRDEENHLAVAWVEVNELETLASLEAVRTIRTVMPPLVRTGSVTTEGDAIHRTSDVRATYSQSGSGMKVGIISDGVNHWTDARDSGDLPASLTVLSDTVGGDEGTAMLEIVHDMVPDADLYFHDCGSNTVAFNSAIDALVTAGCDVICDDIGWITQPFFEDGIIASHLTTVLSSDDIIYASSAGNAGNKHYQGDYYPISGSTQHDFSRGGTSWYYLYLNMSAGSSVQIVLQWNDQFGSSGNDYDLGLYSFDLGDYVAVSADTQDGDDDPLEFISVTVPGGTPTGDYAIVVEKYSGVGKTLEVYIYPASGTSIYTNNIDPVDSIFGHPAVSDAIAVGAIDASDPDNDEIELFSSQGPVTISYPSPESRDKNDICGIDGVSVTGAGSFPSTFYGTSAAAPHIAAIAAQLWGAFPSATVNEVRTCLYSTAVDLGDPGYDYVFGHGRADAFEAYQCLDNATEGGDFVDVLSVDASNFTKIWVYVSVNTTEGRAGNLTESDFEVYEDGVRQTIESFYAAGVGGITTTADILFVFDDTGSMGDEISDMKAKCKDLTDAIEAAGIDARYALVSFKDEPELDQGWTSNATTFKSAVDALSASGGGDWPEDDLDALEMGLGLGFRASTQKVVIDITDAPTHYKGDGSGYSNYTMSEVATDLISSGVAYIAVSPDASADNEKKVLAADVGGLWIDIHGGNFSEILDRIVGVITTAYHIDYTTTNPAEDCTTRTVEVVVHDPVAGTDSDTGMYIAPCPVSGNEVYFVPQESSAPYCSTTDVEIWVNATNLQSGQIKLTYDSTCANVTNWVRDTTNFPMGTWTHSVGGEWITFMGISSLTGEYLIGTLTIHCVSEDECSTTLDFVTTGAESSALFDPGGAEITGVNWIDGTFDCITGICGDVAPYPGGDGVVNMGDVVRLLNHVGNPSEFPVDSWAGDVNCNGVINMGDVVLLLNHVGNPDDFPLECC